MFMAVDLCADEQASDIGIDHSNKGARRSDMTTQVAFECKLKFELVSPESGLML